MLWIAHVVTDLGILSVIVGYATLLYREPKAGETKVRKSLLIAAVLVILGLVGWSRYQQSCDDCKRQEESREERRELLRTLEALKHR